MIYRLISHVFSKFANHININLLVLFLGIVCFFSIAPRSILLPTNLAWIGPYDPFVHYLGWAIFQDSPWSWPIGLNPDYGLQISS